MGRWLMQNSFQLTDGSILQNGHDDKEEEISSLRPIHTASREKPITRF